MITHKYGEGEDDESAAIQIDIELFATKASVDDRYRDTPLYLAPEDEVGQEAFAVIRDAMRKKKAVGVARVVMASRERFMMLEPCGKGIIGTLLHYPHDVRSKAVLEEIKDLNLPDQMIGLAEDIIDRMSVRAGEIPVPPRHRDDRVYPSHPRGPSGGEGETRTVDQRRRPDRYAHAQY